MEKVIGIHLDVSKAASEVIVAAIKKAGIEYPRYYPFAPHLTLYQGRFHAGNYAGLVRQLGALELNAVCLRIQKINVWHNKNGNAFLSLAVGRTPQILKLHQQVLRPANVLRGTLIRDKDQRLIANGALNRQERQYIERYGSQHVLSLFHPHITLGEVPGQAAAETIKKLKPYLQRLQKMELEFSTIKIGLYDFDNARRKYVNVVREKEIRLQEE
ncbi:MAG: DUF1045 domain-containing protein [Patescibacteria group bacterium]|nr:DUF1045 domain-containing protein [Patescibacteria group bacterium]MDD5716107.1 DUF1045 domain-containing protein [Patescibacteria group bacterium]